MIIKQQQNKKQRKNPVFSTMVKLLKISQIIFVVKLHGACRHMKAMLITTAVALNPVKLYEKLTKKEKQQQHTTGRKLNPRTDGGGTQVCGNSEPYTCLSAPMANPDEPYVCPW